MWRAQAAALEVQAKQDREAAAKAMAESVRAQAEAKAAREEAAKQERERELAEVSADVNADAAGRTMTTVIVIPAPCSRPILVTCRRMPPRHRRKSRNTARNLQLRRRRGSESARACRRGYVALPPH